MDSTMKLDLALSAFTGEDAFFTYNSQILYRTRFLLNYMVFPKIDPSLVDNNLICMLTSQTMKNFIYAIKYGKQYETVNSI